MLLFHISHNNYTILLQDSSKMTIYISKSVASEQIALHRIFLELSRLLWSPWQCWMLDKLRYPLSAKTHNMCLPNSTPALRLRTRNASALILSIWLHTLCSFQSYILLQNTTTYRLLSWLRPCSGLKPRPKQLSIFLTNERHFKTMGSWGSWE